MQKKTLHLNRNGSDYKVFSFGSPCWARTSDCCILCEQSAVDTAKHSRLGRSYIRFRYSLFSPLTRKNSHSGCFFSVNYRLRRSVAERGIAIRDVAGWIQSKGAKRKPSDWMVFFLAPRAGLEPATS